MAIRVALRVAYDGTEFRGFAINPGVPTVGGEIRRALAQVVQYEPTITCAGRTDAGVHARGQVLTVDLEELRDTTERLRRSLDQLTPASISIADVWVVRTDFDARHSATRRTYRYTVENRRVSDPLLRDQVWHVAKPIDLDAMRLVSAEFLGTHDFSSFCRRKFVTLLDGEEVEATRVRSVHSAEWVRDTADPDLVRFWISASSFCQQMVRSIVGTIVDVGTGRVDPSVVPAMFAASDRNAAGTVAPPGGLVLWGVGYDNDPSVTDRPGEITGFA